MKLHVANQFNFTDWPSFALRSKANLLCHIKRTQILLVNSTYMLFVEQECTLGYNWVIISLFDWRIMWIQETHIIIDLYTYKSDKMRHDSSIWYYIEYNYHDGFIEKYSSKCVIYIMICYNVCCKVYFILNYGFQEKIITDNFIIIKVLRTSYLCSVERLSMFSFWSFVSAVSRIEYKCTCKRRNKRNDINNSKF